MAASTNLTIFWDLKSNISEKKKFEVFVYSAFAMAKRNLEDFEEDISENKRFLNDLQGEKKHTLDSDESDDEEEP